MRFSSSSLLLALPLLGVAAESPFEQYKAQFQNFIGSFNFGSYLPKPSPPKDEAKTKAAETKSRSPKMEFLTLSNWKETLYKPVRAGATKPEEWWVLTTGGNKTCFGHCGKVETAFNETAAKFASVPKAPHMGYLNCENEPVLCNSWAAATGNLWVFEMMPPPAKTDVYFLRLNLTTTTSKDLLDLYALESKEDFAHHEGYFHPLDGVLATNGLAVPVGYILYFFNVVPSWAIMLVVSFLSRSMMSRRMDNFNRPAAGAAGAGPRAAPPGDAAGPR